MPSQIKVDQIAGATGSTVTLPSGQTLDLSSGTVNLPSTSLSTLNATNLTTGTVPNARLSGITADKLDLISTASVPSITAKGTPSVSDGYIQLNCEQNSHGIKIKSPPHSAAASYTMVMPNAIGTSNQVLRMNSGATALEFGTVSGSTLATPVSLTSGTQIDFTGIPAGTKLIIVSISACSFGSSDHFRLQIGDSGGVETSGYDCGLVELTGNAAYDSYNYSNGLPVYLGTSSRIVTTTATISLIDSSTNIYNLQCIYYGNGYGQGLSCGTKTLSGTLDRVRLTGTAGGTFDGGSANIMYI